MDITNIIPATKPVEPAPAKMVPPIAPEPALKTLLNIPLKETIPAAFRQENVINAGIDIYNAPSFKVEKGYNPYLDPANEPFIDHPDMDGIRSEEEATYWRSIIEKERKDKATIQASGVPGILASVAAGVLSPEMLIPIYGLGSKAHVLSKAVAIGAQVAVPELARQTVLHQAQIDRSISTSTEAVVGALVLGGVFGGVAKRAKTGTPASPAGTPASPAGTSAAAGINEMSPVAIDAVGKYIKGGQEPAGSELVGGWFKSVLNFPAKVNPGYRLAKSKSEASRRAGEELAENAFITKANVEGRATEASIETLIDAAKVGPNNDLFELAKLAKSTENANKFYEEVSYWARFPTDEIPHTVSDTVLKGREIFRRSIDDSLAELENVKVGTGSATMARKTGDALRDPLYVPTYWNVPKIVNNIRVFSSDYGNYLNTVVADGAKRREMINELVTKIMQKDTPSGIFFGDADTLVTSNALKHPDVAKYLINDAATLLRRHHNKSIAGRVMAQQFPADHIAKIKEAMATEYGLLTKAASDEYKAKVLELFPGASVLPDGYEDLLQGAQKAKEVTYRYKMGRKHSSLAKAELSDLKDIDALKGRLLGTYGLTDDVGGYWHSISATARNMNVATKMGSAVISALADPAIIVLKSGLGNTTKAMFGLLDPQIRKLSVEQARNIGLATDSVLAHGRAALMGSIDDIDSGVGFAERISGNMASGVIHYSGMNHWNDILSTISAKAASLDYMDVLVKADPSKSEVAMLASVGIDKIKYGVLKRQIAISKDVLEWPDAELASLFNQAVRRTVNSTIVRPGAGDSPLWTSSAGGKFLFQFRSFMTAQTARVTVPSIQRMDRRVAMGTLLAMVLAYASLQTKNKMNGRKLMKHDDDEFYLEVFAGTGLAAVWVEGYQMSTAFTGWGNAYFDRNKMTSLAGPTLSTLSDAASTGRAIMDADGDVTDMTEAQQKRAKRLVPYASLWYARTLMDSGIAD